MAQRQRQMATLGLAIATLAGCMAPSTGPRNAGPSAASRAPSSSEASPQAGSPQADPKATGQALGPPLASAAPLASASTAPAARLGIPARVHLAMPSALLKGSAGLILGNDGVQLLANDGASLIANDGAALLANDGSSLVANDGASLIANDGASYRLKQDHRGNVADFFIALWGADQAMAPSLNGTFVLYGSQALYLAGVLSHLGKLSWKSQVLTPLRLRLPLMGQKQEVAVNVMATPGKLGPTFWLYDVNNRLPGQSALPVDPFMSLEITGLGEGRMVWRPGFKEGESSGFWFQTRFNLATRRSSADLLLRGSSGLEQRRLAWDFDHQGQAGWRSEWSAVVESPQGKDGGVYRRAVLVSQEEGEVLVGIQRAPIQATWPADALFQWIHADGQGQAEMRFHRVLADGSLQDSDTGPTPGQPGFGTTGLRSESLQSLKRLAPKEEDPTFDWPEGRPDTSKMTTVAVP